MTHINSPDLWMHDFPVPRAQDNKYTRGQVIVQGGAAMTGAACLAAYAASRMGAGLVRIAAPDKDSAMVYRCFKSHIIVHEGEVLLDILQEQKSRGVMASVIGPGLGLEDPDVLRQCVLDILKLGIPVVLDADALSVFAGKMEVLFGALHENSVLTPHEGEFCRLFPALKSLLMADREDAVRKAMQLSNAVIVLKGAKTIIAQKRQEMIVNNNAPPHLATAGSGDVLSGMIAGLLAQDMEPFLAASTSVWMHGRAAELHGPGLVAGDLCDILPEVLQETLGIPKKVR